MPGIVTVNTLDTSTAGVLGLRGYLAPDGGLGWINLGLLADFTRNRDQTLLPLEGAPNGLLETFEEIVTQQSFGFELTTRNPLDPNTLAMWAGTEVYETTIGADTVLIPFGSDGISGRLILVEQNSQRAKRSRVNYYPRVTMRGGEATGTAGTEWAGLRFTGRVLALGEYDVPAELAAATPIANNGFMLLTPTETLADTVGMLSTLDDPEPVTPPDPE